MKRIVNQDYSHMISATPIDKAGRWYVYNLKDVPFGWPGNGIKLSLEVNDSQIEWLKLNDQDDGVDEKNIVIDVNHEDSSFISVEEGILKSDPEEPNDFTENNEEFYNEELHETD